MDISSPYADEALVVIDSRLEKVYELFSGHESVKEWLRSMALALFEEARSLPLDGCDALEFSKKLTNNAIENFEANFSIALEQIRSLDPEFKIDCKKGCGSCCRVFLTVMPHEAMNIACEVLDTWSQEQISVLKDFCSQVNARAKREGIRETAFDFFEICPFLDDQVCGSYSFRSLACRSWVSQDVEKCIASQKLRHKVEVPQNAMLMCQKEIVYAAHAAYLSHRELSGNLAGLFVSLHYLLEDLEGVSGRWYQGDKLPGEVV